jgi:tRNA nucleotidyltransferase (CCA-adding enzyme)
MVMSFLDFPEIDKGKIPDDVLFILKRLEEAGFLSFLVGGCVRDLLHHKTGKDWDIVTYARPEQVQKVFHDYKTLLVGRSFQTVTLVINSQVYHISTIRKEKRQKPVVYHKDNYSLLISDLLCRDFTINALAWNPDTGVLDPANGLRDLQRRVIRSLEPDARFQEDPLRMLRAIRIACELSFTIDIAIKMSIMKHAFLTHRVSPERIREEISSILNTTDAQRGIIMIRQYGLEQYIFSIDKVKKELLFSKGMKHPSFSGFNELREDLPDQLALWGRLYFGSCRQAQIFFLPLIRSLRFNRKIIKKIQILLSREWKEMDFNSGMNIRLLMAKLGKENIESLFHLKKTLLLLEQNTDKIKNLLREEERLIKEALQKNPPVSLKDLAIKGEDLIRLGVPEGERIGEILRLLLNEILLSPENNNRDYLLSIVREIMADSTE